jgi:hypothetical protein
VQRTYLLQPSRLFEGMKGLKQISMGTGTDQSNNTGVFFFTPNQDQVVLYMALATIFVVAFEIMGLVSLRDSVEARPCQLFNEHRQFLKIAM